jgi:hypothetical protein
MPHGKCPLLGLQDIKLSFDILAKSLNSNSTFMPSIHGTLPSSQSALT